MGCDGGTIPKRDELVRKKKKPEQKDKDSELSFRWRHCSITQQPLRNPVVACGLGRLYNKDSVIEALLAKSELSETAKHIKNLKDLKDLQLTVNPEYKQLAEKGDAYVDRQASQYICPLIGLEMNGKFRFAFLWGCGCVMSERALKEVKTNVCHKCQQPFKEDDIIILNATGEDLDLMKVRLEARQARIKAEKKAKRKEKESSSESSASSSSTGSVSTGIFVPLENGVIIEVKMKPTKKEENNFVKPKNKVNSLPAKADKGSDSVSKGIADKRSDSVSKGIADKRSDSVSKGIADKRSASFSKEIEEGIKDPLYKKAKIDYSVAKDPNATEVYKSLFTSHQKAQAQTKAHWITYNPFYN